MCVHTILLELWDHAVPFSLHLQKGVSETPRSSVMEDGGIVITTYLLGVLNIAQYL